MVKTICLYLLGKKGLLALKSAVVYREAVQLVVVVGRDSKLQKDYADEIIRCCEEAEIKFVERTRSLHVKCDLSIAVGWRWLILGANNALVVLHDSILPRLRGFNPLVTALIEGHRQVGVTALKAVADYDAGPIISQKIVDIQYPCKIANAIDVVSCLYGELVTDILQRFLLDPSLPAKPQCEEKVTYSLWRDEDDYRINWSLSAEEILRHVDAVGFPYDGAKATMNQKSITVNEVVVHPDVAIANRVVGKVIKLVNNKYPLIVCGSGLIEIREAVYSETRESCLPFKNFRIKLT